MVYVSLSHSSGLKYAKKLEREGVGRWGGRRRDRKSSRNLGLESTLPEGLDQ
jgi:hypothetical protein